MPDREKVIVIGAGPAALGFANNYSGDYLLLEKELEPGGLMRSKHVNGYLFDWAGHIFFTRIRRIQDWVERLLAGNLEWIDRESWVFSKDVFTRYPFQGNTYGLPPQVIKECLLGLIQATYAPELTDPGNFLEWIQAVYGPGIARHFMVPYNEKLWARDLSTMDFEWLGGRVPKPGLSDFIDGALSPGRKDMGPNARFAYPVTGGMASLVSALADPVADRIQTGRTVMNIDPENRVVTDSAGEEHGYDHLVITAPLPEMVRITRNVPERVKQAADRLEYVSVLCANIGVNEPPATEKHWIYFPEEHFLFHRVFVQGNVSPSVCPPNRFSYTAEITYNSRKHVERTTVLDRTVHGLMAAGLIESERHVEAADLIDIPVAYVVPKHRRTDDVALIRLFYAGHDIHLVGRFAEWAYYNMDHALDAGWRLAERLNT